MKTKKSTIVVAAIALAAIAGGGSTFAMWSDSASVDSATITSGKLAIAAGAQQAFDISTDSNAPGAIDLDTFKTVPGDVLRVSQPMTITLEGDNIAANLEIKDAGGTVLATGAGMTGELAADPNGMKLTNIKVVEGAVPASGDITGLPVFDPTTDTFDQDDNGQTFSVVFDVTFDPGTPLKVQQEKTAELTGVTASLTQVRPAAAEVPSEG